MRKFKIAVIDTALNTENLLENMHSKIEIKDYFYHDSKPLHSTLVINTLIKYMDSNLIEKIFLYNVFCGENKGSGIATILALEDIIIKSDVDFMIMAITLNNKERYEYIENLCKKITSLGITIIAADSNRFTEKKCYPFSFDCVYGISQGAFVKKPFFCVDDMKIKHILGDAAPEFICYGKNNYCLFGGTSKAVPKFLASIINAFSGKNDIGSKKIKEWVKANSLSSEDNTIRQIKENNYHVVYQQEIYDILCKYISECPIDMSKHGELTPSFHMGQLGSHDLALFLIYILKKFNIDTRLEDMRYTDFASLGNLCAYIGGQI